MLCTLILGALFQFGGAMPPFHLAKIRSCLPLDPAMQKQTSANQSPYVFIFNRPVFVCFFIVIYETNFTVRIPAAPLTICQMAVL